MSNIHMKEFQVTDISRRRVPGLARSSAYSQPYGIERRGFLRILAGSLSAAAVPGLLAACAPAAAPAAAPTTSSGGPTGSAAPQTAARASNREPIKLGFIALTDCASLVMASEL